MRRCWLPLVLAVAACGPRRSPLVGGSAVDEVAITRYENGASLPQAMRHDRREVDALFAIASAPGDWHKIWDTPPNGERAVAFYASGRLVGVARFGQTFLSVRTDSTLLMRSIDSSTHRRLLGLTMPWPPEAEEYPAADPLHGPPASIDYLADPDDRRFRTQLENARRGPPDFNGHYQFIVWGCGTQCTSHVILDMQTGRAYDDTMVHFECGNVGYSPTSALVVYKADTLMEKGDPCRTLPTRYFVWSSDRFVELTEGEGAPWTASPW